MIGELLKGKKTQTKIKTKNLEDQNSKKIFRKLKMKFSIFKEFKIYLTLCFCMSLYSTSLTLCFDNFHKLAPLGLLLICRDLMVRAKYSC
jgi:hypothetical protein